MLYLLESAFEVLLRLILILTGPSKRQATTSSVSNQYWYEEPDYRDEVSSKSGFEDEFLSRPIDSPAGNSIDRWILGQPSSPTSPPVSPTMGRYRGESSFPLPNDEWASWPQTWRDVIVKPT